MAANDIVSRFLAIGSMAFAITAFARPDVVDALTLDASLKLAQLERKVAECSERKRNKQLDIFDAEELRSLDISRTEAVTALNYLSGRNAYRCEEPERHAAAFSLGTLAAAKREYQIEDIEIQDVLSYTIYPSVKYLEISVDYAKLPLHAREYFERRVGHQPFNVLDTLKSFPRF